MKSIFKSILSFAAPLIGVYAYQIFKNGLSIKLMIALFNVTIIYAALAIIINWLFLYFEKKRRKQDRKLD